MLLVSYQHTTLTQAENLLAGVLGDLQGNVSKVRWVSAELQGNITEALRFWSALTGMWEARTDPIAIVAGTASSPWVDVPASTPLRAYSVYDRSLIGRLQYHLWEPYDPIDGTGMTDMWTFARIVAALERRRNQFLLDTRCRLTRLETPSDPDLILAPEYALPDTVIEVVRAAWVDPLSDTRHYLGEVSNWSARNSRSSILQSPGLPRSYQTSGAPITIEFTPEPASGGRLDLLVVQTGAALDPAAGASGTLVGIPDDFAAAIMWGAMADLLAEDGPGRDYARALFCERRYRMYVAAVLTNGPLQGALINGRHVQLQTLAQLDAGRPLWQSKSGIPTVVAWAGGNIVAIADPPGSDIQLQLDLIRNAPIPVDGDDYLQVGRELLDVILGYSAHLCSFKLMGSELAASTHLADNFFEAASEYNQRLAASVAFQNLRMGKQEEETAVRGLRRVTGNTVNEDQSGYK